jgi:hypothetical protein
LRANWIPFAAMFRAKRDLGRPRAAKLRKNPLEFLSIS